MKILMSLLILVLWSPCYANFDLDTLLNHTNSMQADYEQVIYDNKNKVIHKSSGRMTLQRPGKLRWEVRKPLPQLIIANGSKLWIYDSDLEQVTIRKLSNIAGETPALLLSQHQANLEKDFYIKEMSAKNNKRWFSFTPKRPDNVFEYIQMGFTNSQLNEMRLKDNLGHIMSIHYVNIKINSKLTPSLFTFNPPKNVDVLDESK